MTKAPDDIDINRKALGQALAHPLTWVPFAFIAGAFAFFGVPWWMCLLIALAAAVTLAGIWAKRWPTLTQGARTEVLAQYRQQQNRDLDRRIGRLELPWAKGQQFVQELRGAMEIKRNVENRLWGDGVLTPQEEEVGRMFADLVRIMIEEAEKTSQEGAAGATGAVVERFEKAARTLRQAAQEIDTILDPVPAALRLSEERVDALAQASERLNERMEQARGVRRHMERKLETETLPDAGKETVSRPVSES